MTDSNPKTTIEFLTDKGKTIKVTLLLGPAGKWKQEGDASKWIALSVDDREELQSIWAAHRAEHLAGVIKVAE
jgi:hypothetical protein